MKVRIESVFADGWVDFSCSLGRGQARWKGSPPDFGREYFVELALENPIEVTTAIAQVPLLDADRERCLLRGRIERVSNGVSSLRVGEARLDLEGALIGWVAVRSSALVLFDQNI